MTIRNWKRALGLGFLSWLLPFSISFAVFPLKRVNASLFDTIMSWFVVVTATMLARRLLTVGETVLGGFVGLAINLSTNYPMFADGPMRMSAAK